jgi:hypothetical protein
VDFEQYIIQGEPVRKERAENWQVAIGLQAVDGLKPSHYLLQTAQGHIEERISIDEVERRIAAYYRTEEGRREEAVRAKITGQVNEMMQNRPLFAW